MKIRMNSMVKIIDGKGRNSLYNNLYGYVRKITPKDGKTFYTVRVNQANEIVVEEDEIEKI